VLDETRQREILAILPVGCSRRTAARYVGCAVSTIQNTADRDPSFAEKLRQAEYQHEFAYLRNIQQAAKKPQYWRAAAWVLERVVPEKYARRGPDVITIDQIKQVLAQFAEIIVAEVPVAKYRQKIIKRLESLTKSLCRPPQLKGTDHES
jgi:hypothetical protein